MRNFSSYGPVDMVLNYYAPRTELINFAHEQLLGELPERGGHYITVWAPRQRGKSWVMQQTLWRLQEDARFDTLKINLEHLKMTEDVVHVFQAIAAEIAKRLNLPPIPIKTLKDFYLVFEQGHLPKPLILILDEFDALHPEAISGIVGVFRNVYNSRRDSPLPTEQKPYLLHGVALIGVRAVLGVENMTGSPFNVQRSLHIPNLTYEEVDSMFQWYQKESGQAIDPEVIERLFYELQGQPGLTSWFGELLTETYNLTPDQPITIEQFERVYLEALNVLPNNNILNIISKVKQEPYQEFVLGLFQTNEKIPFRYDEPQVSFLYMNGAIEVDRISPTESYVKFANSFVQRRLFNYFSGMLFQTADRLHDPFADLEEVVTETELHVDKLLQLYEAYVSQHHSWLFSDAPRRKKDLRIYEAVYHFSLYMYLFKFITRRGGKVWPEFPTGNGKIDIIIQYADHIYGLEVKSFADQPAYKAALPQAAKYGQELGLRQIWLALFVEAVDETNRKRFEVVYEDETTGVTVRPVFVQTGPWE